METNDRLSRLMATKEEKIAAFNASATSAGQAQESFSNTQTVTEEGYVDHNGNKIVGISEDWTRGQNAFADKYMKDNYSLPDESRSDRRFYGYGIKDEGLAVDPSSEFRAEDYDPAKIGLASGRHTSSDPRYTPQDTGYDRDSGPRGVDIAKKFRDDNMDFVAATTMEALINSNKHALDSRLLRKRDDGFYDYASPEGMKVISREERDSMFGSGSSEYYSNLKDIYDDTEVLTDEQRQEVISGIEKAIQITAGRYSKRVPQTSDEGEARRAAIIDKYSNSSLSNSLSGLGSSFVNELLVKPADALGDLTGLYDLDKDGDTTGAVEDFFGYDQNAANKAMKKVGDYFDVAMDENSSTLEKVRAVGNGILEAFITPELLGTSFGTLMAWAAPGSLFNLMGKGTKYASKVSEISKKVESGAISKFDGAVEKAKEFMSIDGASSFLTKQSGQITASLGNINKQYEEFVANNGGVELEGADKASWFAGRFAVQIINQNLDKFVDIKALKAPGLVQALTPGVKAMGDKEFLKVANVLSKGFGVTVATAGVEAAQEYAQTSMELLNARFGSEAFKDLDTVVDFLSAEDNVREASIGAIAGAGGAGQFQVLGGLSPVAKGISELSSNALSKTTSSVKGVGAPAASSTNTAPSQEEVVDAKSKYKEVLVRLVTTTAEGVNESNIGSLVDDVDTLNATRSSIDSSDPEEQKKADDLYNSSIDALEKFILDNSQLKLTKSLKRRNPVKDVEADSYDESKVPDDVKKAFTVLSAAMGDGEERPFSSSTTRVSAKFKKSAFSDMFFEGSDIEEEVKNVELALTGKISDTIEETFETVKANVIGKKASDFMTQPTAEPDVLGSSPTSNPSSVAVDTADAYQTVEYDDFSRRVVAEGVIRTVLGSGRTYAKETQEKLKVFAKTNGVKKERVEEILKSYASVEVEATVGPRGYASRLNRLASLVESSNPDDKQASKEFEGIMSMYSAVAKSETQLSRGIKAAIKKADSANKSKLPKDKVGQFVTEYMKYNPKTRQYDDPFKINFKKVDGKWVADLEQAEKALAQKKRYTKEIMQGLREISDRNDGKIKSIPSVSDGVSIPVKEGRNKVKRQRDVKHLKDVMTIVSSIIPDSNGVNKVILGDRSGAKWSTKGDYYKLNAHNINRESYQKGDVVLLNTSGSDALSSEVKKSLDMAMESGATIVLDSDMVIARQTKKGRKEEFLIDRYLTKSKLYEKITGTSKAIYVKSTPETAKAVKKAKETLETLEASKVARKKDADELVSLTRALSLGVDPKTGEDLTGAAKDKIEERAKSLVYAVAATENFGGDKDKVKAYVNRRVDSDVAVEAKSILDDDDPDVISYDDKAFQKSVEAYIEREENKDKVGAELIEAWSEVTSDVDSSRKEREKSLKSVIAKAGLSARSMMDSVLGENSISKGKDYLYEKVYQDVATGNEVVRPARKNMTDSELEAAIVKNSTSGHKLGSKKVIFLGIRRVSQDINDSVQVTKTTVLNSVPVDYMPFTIRSAVEAFSDKASKVLEKVSEPEKAEQTGDTGKGYLPGNLNLHNSPARGLFLGKDGKVHKETMAAVYLALGNVVSKDAGTWSRSYKPDVDVASMFNVREGELTDEMRRFAYENGILLKTAATALGKEVVKHLGLSEKIGSEVTAFEYGALVADIGNTALLVAEEQGLVETTSKSSNAMSELYRDGEKREVDTKTHFIHIKDKKDDSGKYAVNVMANNVSKFKEGFESATEKFPEVVTDRKGPYFKAPTEERLKKASETVRNDISGKAVPDRAKETIKHLMETPYTVSLERLNELLDAVDADGSRVMENLGYVELTSEKFSGMYFKDREVQEGKNRDIEKSIQELRNLKDKLDSDGVSSMEMYFDYFYSTNDRYMLDSNTINPQTDKLHRFLVVPSGHKLDYRVSKPKDGGVLFEVKNTENVEDADQSYVVRMALAQALGADVDKMDSLDIIEFGNTVLSMSTDDVAMAKEAILDKGEFTLLIDDKEVTLKYKNSDEGNIDVEQVNEAPHLTHALQALDFLAKVSAIGDGGEMTSSLSLEFDSLTSGFANKIQQMPILKDMVMHYARTGIITKEYAAILESLGGFKGEGVAFDPKKGHAVSDVIGAKDIGFQDSYKALSETTIIELRKGHVQAQNLSVGAKTGSRSGSMVFDIIKPLLPGGESIDSNDVNITISSAMRKLFKDPFMIFNYSASIARIVKNLGSNVANDIAKAIATSDLSDENNASTLDVAENIVNRVKVMNPETEKLVETVEELQKLLRNYRLSAIKLQRPLTVGVDKEGTKAKPSRDLANLLETTVGLTYGEVIKEVFEDTFKPFIEVQDSMNDAFKVAFRIFDKKRVDMLNKIRLEKEDRFISLEDHANVLDALWDDFPWIVGPLTGLDSENKPSKKDIISVVSTSTRAPNSIEEARKKPQAVLAKGATKTRTVSPLIKYLEEAVSSGSVLPFHAIDGAEISNMFAQMGVRAIAAIHDAVIPPLHLSDAAGFTYNKGMVETNTEYSLADALDGLVERINKTINSKDFDKDFKKVSVLGLKAADPKKEENFVELAAKVSNNLSGQTSLINRKRKEYYGPGGKLRGALVGNLVGTPGGVFTEGMEKPDLSYKEEFKKHYKTYNVSIKSDGTAEESVTPVFVFTENVKLLKELNGALRSDGTVEGMLEALESDVGRVKLLQKKFTSRAKKTKDKKLSEDLLQLSERLSVFTYDDSGTIDENTSVSDMNKKLAKKAEDNKDCGK